MSNKINCISFHEDFVLWTELSFNDKSIELHKAVSDSLPRTIDHSSINDSTFSTELTELVKTLCDINHFDVNRVRISLSNKFSIIKRIQVDNTIPIENYREMILFELEKSWGESSENYNIYLVEEVQKNKIYIDLLVVAVRKNVLNFFENVFNSANLEVEVISPSCFMIDEFYRKLYSLTPGKSLLLGWQRRGYDILISDKNNFVHYTFKPYNSDLDSIEQLDEDHLISSFENLIEEVRQPAILEKPLYEINSLYLYGFHFKPEWLEMLKAQVHIPVKLLNFSESSAYQFTSANSEITEENIFQFIEPISNIIF